MIQDSGNRAEFESGAVRDVQTGKGRCDLLPLDVISTIIDSPMPTVSPIYPVHHFMASGDVGDLFMAIEYFIKEKSIDTFTAMLELAIHYEEGCSKYGENNWRLGIPVSRYIDSAVRHYLKYRRGDTDERHDRAFMWNIVGAIWTSWHKPELDDIDHDSYAGKSKNES